MQHPATLRAFPVSIGALIAALAMALLVAFPVAAGIPVAVTAASYINPDTGAASENPNVDPGSECETPDQFDTQQVSPVGTTTNNVHNDACLFDALGLDVDAQVSFESSGVGVISACPDPDGAGLKTATNTGTRCTLTGYQETGAMGDFEYHARLNSEVSGTQTVVFCQDPEANGCGDATISDTITIVWSGPAATAASYINPDTGAASANPDVNADSDCETPDSADTQQVSPAGSTANNVHNDACLFDALGFDVDAQVSFESSGVGVISGCPDPDGAGPKTATNTGTRCTLTGYQETGAMGDFEYHARLNSQVAGTQTVVFCYDPEANGCGDATIGDFISVTWTAAVAGPTASPAPVATALPNTGVPAAGSQSWTGGFAVILGLVTVAAVASLGYRSLAVRRTS